MSDSLSEPLLLRLGRRRLGRIFYLTGFVVRLPPVTRMFSLGLIVELGDRHMLEPISFLAFRAVHRGVASTGGVRTMEMVEPGLPAVRLRFDAECAFDALTDEEQFRGGIADGFVEHQELDSAVAFIEPHMVGRIRLHRYIRVGVEEG